MVNHPNLYVWREEDPCHQGVARKIGICGLYIFSNTSVPLTQMDTPTLSWTPADSSLRRFSRSPTAQMCCRREQFEPLRVARVHHRNQDDPIQPRIDAVRLRPSWEIRSHRILFVLDEDTVYAPYPATYHSALPGGAGCLPSYAPSESSRTFPLIE